MVDFDFSAHAKYQPPSTPGVPNLAGYSNAISSMVRDGYRSASRAIDKAADKVAAKQKEKEVGTAFQDLTDAYNDKEMWETRTVRPADSTAFSQFIKDNPGDLGKATDEYVAYLEDKKGIDPVEGRTRAQMLLNPYTEYVAKPGTEQVVEAYENKLRTLGVPESQITSMRTENMVDRYLQGGQQNEAARLRGGIIEGTSRITEDVGKTVSTMRAQEGVAGEIFPNVLDRAGQGMRQQAEIQRESSDLGRRDAFEYTRETFDFALGMEVDRAKALGEAEYAQKKAQMQDQNLLTNDALNSIDEVVGSMTATMVGGRDLASSGKVWPNFDILQSDIAGMEPGDPLKAVGEMARADMGTASFITPARRGILRDKIAKANPGVNAGVIDELLTAKLESLNVYTSKDRALQAVDEMLAPIVQRSGKNDYMSRQISGYSGGRGGGGFDSTAALGGLLGSGDLPKPLAGTPEKKLKDIGIDEPGAALQDFVGGNDNLGSLMKQGDVKLEVVNGAPEIVSSSKDPQVIQGWKKFSEERRLNIAVQMIAEQTGGLLTKQRIMDNIDTLYPALISGSVRQAAAKLQGQSDDLGGELLKGGPLGSRVSGFTGTTDGVLQPGVSPWEAANR